MDPISPTFCAAKWYNATIWLDHGTTASCHLPLAHKIPVDEIKKNVTALHNTAYKKSMREQMLQGERPTECEYCWKIEDIKRDNVSDRIFKSVIYQDDEITHLKKITSMSNIIPKTLEIAFDRSCNFACSYCNASFSSTWSQDIKTHGPYTNLISDGAGAYQNDGDHTIPFGKDEENPYVEAFWKWWPELSKNLQELRITGGEPLMSKHTWRLLDFFKEKGASGICLSINSNLGAKKEIIHKLIEASHHIENFQLYTSCEAIGRQAEYIRDGLKFDYFLENINDILSHAKIRSLNMMMTVNSLCLFSMTNFFDIMISLKEKFGRFYPVWSLNILRYPSFMSPLALPKELIEDRRDHLKKWFEKNQNHKLIHETERDSVERLIDYLDVVKTPHFKSSAKEKLNLDFKSFYSQYDIRRKKNFTHTFPKELSAWYEGIPL